MKYGNRIDLVDFGKNPVEANCFGDIIGASAPMKDVYTNMIASAKNKYPVLIMGETGTGKELVARNIYRLYVDNKSDKPFVVINCPAIPDTLAESEFFGYEKGAFTGASSKKPGQFELAHGGVLFLDEVAKTSMEIQGKILRTVETGELMALGSKSLNNGNVDVKIVASTNKNLMEAIEEGTFREDLYYRLYVCEIEIPPLRERNGDVSLLARYFLGQYNKENNKVKKREDRIVKYFEEDALELLDSMIFPGNVRELQNIVRRAAIKTNGERIGTDYIERGKEKIQSVIDGDYIKIKMDGRKLDDIKSDVEKEAIRAALERNNGNRTHAAKELDISTPTLLKRMKLYRISIDSSVTSPA